MFITILPIQPSDYLNCLNLGTLQILWNRKIYI